MNQCVDTELLTLQRVVEQKYQFIIPSYQRPYVWTSDEIKRLLEDIIQHIYLKNLIIMWEVP